MKVLILWEDPILFEDFANLLKNFQSLGIETRVVLGKKCVSFRDQIFSLCGNTLSNDVFSSDHSRTDHIELARWNDFTLLYGLSPERLASLALGRANDFFSLQCLATKNPIYIGSNLDERIINHPAIQNNLETLEKLKISLVPIKETLNVFRKLLSPKNRPQRDQQPQS